jgi:hypothetical protein
MTYAPVEVARNTNIAAWIMPERKFFSPAGLERFTKCFFMRLDATINHMRVTGGF